MSETLVLVLLEPSTGPEAMPLCSRAGSECRHLMLVFMVPFRMNTPASSQINDEFQRGRTLCRT